MEIYALITHTKKGIRTKYYKNPIVKPKHGFNFYEIYVTKSSLSFDGNYEECMCTISNIFGKSICEFSYKISKITRNIVVELLKQTSSLTFIQIYKIVEFVLEKGFHITDHWIRLRFSIGDDLYINVSRAYSYTTVQLKGYVSGGDQPLFRIELDPRGKGILKLFEYNEKIGYYEENEYIYYIDNEDIVTNLDYMNNDKKAKELLYSRYNEIKKCIDYIEFDPLDYDIV